MLQAVQRALPLPGQATSELTRSASMVLHMVKTEGKVKVVGFGTILKDDSAKACLGDKELEQISKEAKTIMAQLKQVGQLDAGRGVDVMTGNIQHALETGYCQGSCTCQTGCVPQSEAQHLGYALTKGYSVLGGLRSDDSGEVTALRKQLECVVNRMGRLISEGGRLKAEEVARQRRLLREENMSAGHLVSEAQRPDDKDLSSAKQIADDEARQIAAEAACLIAEHEEAKQLNFAETVVANVVMVKTWSTVSMLRPEEEAGLKIATDDEVKRRVIGDQKEAQQKALLCCKLFEVQATQGVQARHWPQLPTRTSFDRQVSIAILRMRCCNNPKCKLYRVVAWLTLCITGHGRGPYIDGNQSICSQYAVN